MAINLGSSSILDRIQENYSSTLQVVNTTPKVYIIDNFLSNNECEHLINISTQFSRAKVTGGKNTTFSKDRTGSNCWIKHDKDAITDDISNRISNIIGVPLVNAEKFQMLHYNETQEYRRHYDGWLLDGSIKSRQNLQYGGQRIYTVLGYLNDVIEGGGTNFPRIHTTISAKKGRIVIFENVYEGTNTRHPLAEHAGMPVLKGEKFAFNLWFREIPMNKIFDYKVDPKYEK